ncbi:MAG: PEP-CTERM sorting domain-containing protein [Opitutus sp.]
MSQTPYHPHSLPELSASVASFELRVYGNPEYARDIFQDGPGLYVNDTRIWATARADEMTATVVKHPPFTPVPEPATTGLIAALGLGGLIDWRRWLGARSDNFSKTLV